MSTPWHGTTSTDPFFTKLHPRVDLVTTSLLSSHKLQLYTSFAGHFPITLLMCYLLGKSTCDWTWKWLPFPVALFGSLLRFFVSLFCCCFFDGFNLQLRWNDFCLILLQLDRRATAQQRRHCAMQHLFVCWQLLGYPGRINWRKSCIYVIEGKWKQTREWYKQSADAPSPSLLEQSNHFQHFWPCWCNIVGMDSLAGEECSTGIAYPHREYTGVK